jgi:hypothetical protein
MSISEQVVETVVGHTSERMRDDPDFVQLCVGSFVQAQPEVSRFLSAKAARLGGAEALVQLVFHAHVLLECFEAGLGASPRVVDFRLLDEASQGDFVSDFTQREPHLASYVASNVEQPELRRELCRIGLAMALSR